MKKFFGALVAASFVFAAVFASASVLPLVAGTGSIQASELANVTCQNTPVKLTYGTELAGTGQNQIDRVILSNIDATCYGDQAFVALFKNDPPYSGLTTGVDTWYNWGTISAPTITLTFGHTGDPTATKPLAIDVKHFNVMFSAQ